MSTQPLVHPPLRRSPRSGLGFTRPRLFAAFTALFGGISLADAQLYWRTDGTSATWNSSSWSAGSATATGGTSWPAGSAAIFTTNSTVSTGPTTLYGNVTVSDGVTVTVTSYNRKFHNTTVRTYDIGAGATLNWAAQYYEGGAGLTKNGAGTWNIATITGSFTGGFTLNAGEVIVSGSTALGSGALTLNGGTIRSSGTVAYIPATIAVGGDFAVAGSGAASFAAPVALGSATRTLTNNQSSDALTFSGAISGSSGGGLVFAGTGNTVLSNAANSYTGGTTVNGGTLTLGHATALQSATGLLTVSGGTLATSVAATTIGSDLTFTSGMLALNDTSAGSLTLASGKTFTMSGGTFNLTLGSSFDQIVSAGSGTLSLTGGILEFDPTGAGFDYGHSYQIFSGFDAAAFGSLTLSGYDTADYTAAISNTGLLSFTSNASAVPEPSTYAALAGALALAAAFTCRRRHIA